MNGERKKKLKRKKLAAILLPILAVSVVLIASAVLLIVIRVDSVEVRGNFYSDRETVISAVLPEERDTRLYRVILKSIFGVGNEDAFVSCKIRLTGLQSAEINVRETNAVCRIETEDGNIFLNGNGVVLGAGAGNADLLPSLLGVKVLGVTELRKLETENDEELTGALTVLSYVRKFDLRPESVTVRNGNYEASFGDVTVKFGSVEHMQEKATELANQYPHYKGLKGIMHLESGFSEGETRKFTFEVVP